MSASDQGQAYALYFQSTKRKPDPDLVEFLRGVSSNSIMQTTSLVAFPTLMENLPARRYSVIGVVNVMKSLLVQLEEMGMERSLRVAEVFRPMLAEMEGYLARQAKPEFAHLNDAFAERLVGLARQLGSAVRNELAGTGNPKSE